MLVDMNRVDWLTKTEIEQEASKLLSDWSAFIGQEARPPIPVEAMIENFLGIALEFEDLEATLGIPGVLGATWVNEKKMAINDRLLDGGEGRIIFTCGHEVGHWVLHRGYFFDRFSRLDPGGDTDSPPIICRTSASKERGEWQADFFSGCLIMPGIEVKEAYERAFGQDPIVLHNEKSCFGRHNPVVLDPALDTVKEIAQKVIEHGAFTNASREAMAYRLQELGLLVNATGKRLFHPPLSTAPLATSPRPAAQ